MKNIKFNVLIKIEKVIFYENVEKFKGGKGDKIGRQVVDFAPFSS